MRKQAPSKSDPQLLNSGPHGFAEFYARHEAAVLRYFLRRTRRADLAADLTAETFARALEGRARFSPEKGTAKNWLFGIAQHVLVQSLEYGRVEALARERLSLERLVLDDAALTRIEDLGSELSRAMELIPGEQRAAIFGRVIEGREYEELAAKLSCSEAVVRQRVSRGLRTLKTYTEVSE